MFILIRGVTVRKIQLHLGNTFHFDINSTSMASTTLHGRFKIQFQIRIKSLHPSVKIQQALRPQ